MDELLSALAAGCALGLSAGFGPGPLTALLLRESLRHGTRAGLRIACVPLLSDAPVVILSVFLLRALSGLHLLLALISLCGAVFVAHLARESLREFPSACATAVGTPVSLIEALLTNWTNPHPYLFWITVGAPLVLRPPRPAAGILFAGAFYTCLVAAKAAMAVSTGRFGSALPERWYRRVHRCLGAALAALAVLLAIQGIRLLRAG